MDPLLDRFNVADALGRLGDLRLGAEDRMVEIPPGDPEVSVAQLARLLGSDKLWVETRVRDMVARAVISVTVRSGEMFLSESAARLLKVILETPPVLPWLSEECVALLDWVKSSLASFGGDEDIHVVVCDHGSEYKPTSRFGAAIGPRMEVLKCRGVYHVVIPAGWLHTESARKQLHDSVWG